MPYFAERLERRFSLRTRDGLLVDATTDADDPILASFFEGYDRAFVLANEKEELEGFRTCMALNRPPRYPELREQYGAFREVVLVATDPTIGVLSAGRTLSRFL